MSGYNAPVYVIVERDEVRAGDELVDGYVVERVEPARGPGLAAERVAYLVDGGARFLAPEVLVRRVRHQTTSG